MVSGCFASLFLVRDAFVEVPGVWHLLQGPVNVLGGTLLGIVLALWAPARPTPALGLIVMVLVNLWLNQHGPQELEGGTLGLFGPMVSWAQWGPLGSDHWYRLLPGDPAWHTVYLLGLCGMAVAGSLLRVTGARSAPTGEECGVGPGLGVADAHYVVGDATSC